MYVYILMEFQSTVDRFMALRVLHYLSSFYMDLVRSGEMSGRLPPVFPIVLYNGEAPWTAPTQLEALIEQPELLGRFGVHFEYFKIAENEFSLEELRRIRNLVSMLFMAESHYDLEAPAGELLSLFDHERDHQAISLLMNWFAVLTDKQRIDEEDMKTLQRIHTDREEVRSMLLNTIAREKRQMYEEGKEQGLREGERKMARAMLLRGIAIRDIAEITGLSEKDILLLEDGTDSDD